MLRQKCSYKKETETRKEPKSIEKVELQFAIYEKQEKGKFSPENADM